MSPLSSDDLRAIREELNEGTTPVVWFTDSAVGVPEGRSGKVVAVNEPAEGDFVQVRPAGSKDVLSFSVAELTRVKPPRKKPAPEQASAKAAPAKVGAGKSAPQAAKSTSRTASAPAAKQPPAEVTTSAPKPPAKSGETTARKPRQAKAASSGAVVTLTADQEGQWTVEVSTPKRRVVKPTPISATAVQQAARVLHEDVSAAVEPVIEAAREQHRARVEALRAELEAAQAALEELGD